MAIVPRSGPSRPAHAFTWPHRPDAAASLGALPSLPTGVGRTAFAMGANGDLPRFLARVHPRHRVPHVAQLVVAAVVVGIGAADVRGAIGFRSFAVLCHYGITNAAARTRGGGLEHPRGLAAPGLAGCPALAFSLAAPAVPIGAVVPAVGVVRWAVGRSGPDAPHDEQHDHRPDDREQEA